MHTATNRPFHNAPPHPHRRAPPRSRPRSSSHSSYPPARKTLSFSYPPSLDPPNRSFLIAYPPPSCYPVAGRRGIAALSVYSHSPARMKLSALFRRCRRILRLEEIYWVMV